MVFSPNIIKTTLDVMQGVSSPSRYQVIITPPSAMLFAGGALGIAGSALSIAGAANVSILATKATLPGRQIATQNFRMYGTNVKMPYGAVYDEVTLTFICTNSMAERLFFDTWQSFVMNTKNQYMHYYDTYVGTVMVAKLGDDAVSSATSAAAANYMLLEAYPVTVESQELDASQSNQILTLRVTFAYRRWTTLAEQIFTSVASASPAFTGSFGTGTQQAIDQVSDILS